MEFASVLITGVAAIGGAITTITLLAFAIVGLNKPRNR